VKPRTVEAVTTTDDGIVITFTDGSRTARPLTSRERVVGAAITAPTSQISTPAAESPIPWVQDNDGPGRPILTADTPVGRYTIDGNNAGRNKWTVVYPDGDYGMVDSQAEAIAWAEGDYADRDGTPVPVHRLRLSPRTLSWLDDADAPWATRILSAAPRADGSVAADLTPSQLVDLDRILARMGAAGEANFDTVDGRSEARSARAGRNQIGRFLTDEGYTLAADGWVLAPRETGTYVSPTTGTILTADAPNVWSEAATGPPKMLSPRALAAAKKRTNREGWHTPTTADLDRLAADGYTIPGYWAEALVPDNPDGKVVVKGLAGTTGKWVHVYTPEWEEKQAAAKYQRGKVLHRAMPRLDARLEADAATDLDAAVVRLMRLTGMRVGDESAIKGRLVKDATYGATTLRAKHARITEAGSVVLTFKGKGKVDQRYVLRDPILTEVFRQRLNGRSRNDPLFEGVTKDTTQAYLRDATGLPDVKNHDLRTYVANTIALAEVRKRKRRPPTMADFKKMRFAVGEAVAKQLGNTRAMALSDYINPAVFDAWRREEWAV
jgi:DNA topoisomerase IB